LLSNEPAAMTIDTATGVITWTPTEGVLTSGSVTLTVDDNNGGTDYEIFTVSVTPVNEPPAIAHAAPISATEDTLYTYAPAATDAEGDTLIWSLINEPNGMLISSTTGYITWTPLEGVITSGVVILTVDDGNGGTDTETFTITVIQVNDPVLITTTAPVTATEDIPYTYNPGANDPDGDALSWSLANEPPGMTIDIGTGAILWIPGNNVLTSGAVTVTVDDNNGSTDSETFTITVTPVNDPPVISGTPITTVPVDTAYSFTPTASDPDAGDTLTFSINVLPAWTTVTFNTGTGELAGTSEAGSTLGIIISVTDGTVSASLPTFDLTVN